MIQNSIRPIADNVLIKRVKAENKTSSGILLPDEYQEKSALGSVISLGKGKRDSHGNFIAPAVSVGDTIYFNKYAGTEIGNDHLLIRENDIIGIVEYK